MLKTVLLQKIKPYRRVNKKGFTLMEMLIVVAVIAILIAVAIPVFSAQLHKARVATDWANLRSFYADIQTDYMTTGEQNPKVPVDWHTNPAYDWHSIPSASVLCRMPRRLAMSALIHSAISPIP